MIDIVVAKRIVVALRDGISFLIKVCLSFVAGGIILPVCDYLELNAIISPLYSVLPPGRKA
jgi:hypothetical protein